MSDDTEALARIYAEMDARTHVLDSLVCAALSAERPVFNAPRARCAIALAS